MSRYASLPKPRTDADRFTDALKFVVNARDHVIRSHTADSICRMKGVTQAKHVEGVRAALAKRVEGAGA